MSTRAQTRRYAVASPETWELARAAYLGGESAPSICTRLGLSEANLRKKARLEGWTKRAWAEVRATLASQAASPPPKARGIGPAAPGPAPAPAGGPGEDLVDTVLTRAREALTAGRASDATALLKALRDYVRVQADVNDARAACERDLALWNAAQPERIDEPREGMTLGLLFQQWSGLPPDELARRTAEHGPPEVKAALRAWLERRR